MDESTLLFERNKYLDITAEFNACHIADGQILTLPSYDLSEAVCSVDVMHPLMDRGLLQIEDMSIFAYYQHATNVLLPASRLAGRGPEREFIRAFSRRLGVLLASFLSGMPVLDTLCVCLPLQVSRVIIRFAPLRWLLWLVRRTAVLATETVARARVVRSDEFSTNSALIERWRSSLLDLGDLSWRDQMALELGTPGEWKRELSLFYQLVCLFENVLGLTGEKDRSIHELCGHYADASDDDRDVGLTETQVRSYGDRDFFIIPLMANVFCTGCVRRPVQWLDEVTAYTVLKRLLCLGWDNLDADGSARSASLGKFLSMNASDDLSLSPITRSILAMIYLPDPISNIAPPTWTESILRLSLHTLARQRRMLPDFFKSWQGSWPSQAKESSEILFLAIWFVVLGFALELYNDGVQDGHEVAEAHRIIAALCRKEDRFEELHETATRLQMQTPVQRTPASVYYNHRRIRRWTPVLPFLEPDTLDYLCMDLHPSDANDHMETRSQPPMTNAQCYAEYLPPSLRAAHSLVLY